MARRSVGPEKLIWEWIDSHSAERVDALLAWCAAVAISHEQVADVQYVQPRAGREVWVSHIPDACTRVAFIVVNAPVHAIWIQEISDEKYEAGWHQSDDR